MIVVECKSRPPPGGLLSLFKGRDRLHVVGRGLVDEVVEPVCEQQVGAGAPGAGGPAGWVVVGVVVLRHRDGQPRVHVPAVLLLQGVGVVLRVAGDEDLPALVGGDGVDPRLLALGQDLQLWAGGDMNVIISMYKAILPASDNLIKSLLIFNVPFTFVKGVIVAVITFIIYKPLSNVIYKMNEAFNNKKKA